MSYAERPTVTGDLEVPVDACLRAAPGPQAADVPGWLKRGQARILWDEARALPPGRDGAGDRQSPGPLHRDPGRGAAPTGRHRDRGRPVRGGQALRRALHPGEVRAQHRRERPGRASSSWCRTTAPRCGPRWTGRSTCSTSTASTTTGRSRTTCAGACTCPRAGPCVIHDCFSSIGVTLGILRHVLLLRPDRLRAPQRLPGAVPRRPAAAPRTGCGSSPRCRGGSATSSSRCCCGCKLRAGRAPPGPRLAVRPVLSRVTTVPRAPRRPGRGADGAAAR